MSKDKDTSYNSKKPSHNPLAPSDPEGKVIKFNMNLRRDPQPCPGMIRSLKSIECFERVFLRIYPGGLYDKSIGSVVIESHPPIAAAIHSVVSLSIFTYGS